MHDLPQSKKWLEQNEVEFNEINIAENPPSTKELAEIYKSSNVELKKFFNTSGMVYRSLALKDRLSSMSEDEQLELLASDGMLIKRPLAFDGNKVTLGFKEPEFEKTWLSTQ